MPTVRDEQLLASIRAGDRAAVQEQAELIREVLRELDIPGISDARGRLDPVVGPLRARLLERLSAPDFALRGSLRGFVTTFVRLFTDHQASILAGEHSTYLRLQLGLAAFVFLLWLVDGAPVLRETLLGAKRVVDALRDRVRGRPADSSRYR